MNDTFGKNSGGLVGLGRERADAARNRERILSAARALMAERPISTICMEAIAERAGVGKGTLYRRFPERASLYIALLDEDARQLQERVIAGFDLPAGTAALELVFRLLSEFFAFSLRNAEILSTALASHPAGSARYDHPGHAWQRTALIAFLKQAVRKGELAPLDLELHAELFLAGLHPDLIQWFLARGGTAELLEARYRASWSRQLGV